MLGALLYAAIGMATCGFWLQNASKPPPIEWHRSGVAAGQVAVLVGTFVIFWPLLWVALCWFVFAELMRRAR
jgi:hypothetical protein